MTDWDDEFANGIHIPGGADYVPRWQRAAQAFRDANPPELLAYGDDPRQVLDLFLPARPAEGLFTFIHGGFFLAFGKDDWSHLAAGALARGFAVAMPSYRIAPQVRIRDMVRDVGAAVTRAADAVPGPVRLAGHSAGGQLALRMIGGDSPLGASLQDRIARVTSISGLHDLRPLMLTKMNETLRLDDAEAAAESPLLGLATRPVSLWVGGDERPEFLRQTRILAEAWPKATRITQPGRHHYDICDGLAEPGSPLMNEVFR